MTLNGRPFTIVGVMPPEFLGIENDAQLWVPFAEYAPPKDMADRGGRGFCVLGRLKPGVTLEAAQSEANTVAARLAREYPGDERGARHRSEPAGDRVLRPAAARRCNC